ncbi:MAG: hypothetical protein E7287_09260 [Lachnospiraceae bacterium]|nr:hypothetical protein [Lachnospiraceae bacterium]
MKRIVCYGDSNTWGYDGESCQRFGDTERWTGLLQELLGTEYKIIEEGLNSRTTVFEDPLAPGKNGLLYLTPMVCSQLPFDLLILMLGTNDLKRMYHVGSFEVAEGIDRLLRTFQNVMLEKTGSVGKVLLLSPIAIEPAANGEYMYGFDEHSKEEAGTLGAALEQVAVMYGCEFADMAKVTAPGKADGIHLDSDGHRAVTEFLAKRIKSMEL